jgi:geranylgeranyl reductase
VNILIIGGGPAGASAARFLAPYHNVTLIQHKEEYEKPCGGGVKTKIFKEFNIPETLIKHRINHVLMKYKNQNIKLDLKGGNLSIVNRKEFDKTLRNLASESGAKIYYGRFKGIKNSAAVIKSENETKYFPYDILIAADGVNSAVRKALNLPKVPSTVTHYAKTSSYPVKTCEFFFDFDTGGDYYAWAFPCENLTHTGTVKRENFENLCRYLGIKEKPKGYKIPLWGKNIIIQKENVFFVGDAAGQVMPLSFEGIYYAVHSAEILADSILHNKNYRHEWNKRFLKEFMFMKTIQTLNKTKLRGFVMYLHRFKAVRNFVINLWLRNHNV